MWREGMEQLAAIYLINGFWEGHGFQFYSLP